MSSETIRALTMPKFGLTMREGTLAKWSVSEGTLLARGDEVATIETDKITNALEASASGVLRRKVADEGVTLPVGALLGVMAPANVPDGEIDAFVSGFEPQRMA